MNLSDVKIDIDSKFHPELRFKRFFVFSTDPGPRQICATNTTKCLEILNVWRNIPFKIQSGYFPYRKINFRVGNQLTGSVIVGLFQTSSLSAISRV